MNEKVDEIDKLQFELEAANMTIKAKETTIIDLKQSIVMGEIKARRLLEQLNENVSGEAQENIDNTLNVL